jgi:hypothetical protein
MIQWPSEEQPATFALAPHHRSLQVSCSVPHMDMQVCHSHPLLISRCKNVRAERSFRLSHQRKPGLRHRACSRKQHSVTRICGASHHKDGRKSTHTYCAWSDGSTCNILLPEEGQGVQVWRVKSGPRKRCLESITCKNMTIFDKFAHVLHSADSMYPNSWLSM